MGNSWWIVGSFINFCKTIARYGMYRNARDCEREVGGGLKKSKMPTGVCRQLAFELIRVYYGSMSVTSPIQLLCT